MRRVGGIRTGNLWICSKIPIIIMLPIIIIVTTIILICVIIIIIIIIVSRAFFIPLQNNKFCDFV